MRNIKRDCRGISTLITDIILISIIVAAGFMLMLWTVNYTSEFNKQFGEAMEADAARLKERLAFELICYDPSQSTLKVYLMNYGTIDNIAIKTVYVYDSTDAPVFSGSVDLKRLDGASTADLDRGEEGFFTLSLSLSYGSYNVRIITGRGSTFERNFIV